MVDEVVARAVAEFGGIDVLVNNAGIMDRTSATHETGDDEWDRVLRVDLTAPFLLTRAVLPHMLPVFTGSEAGLRGGAAGAAYTAAIVWLASGEAAFVDGAVLPVDEGWSAPGHRLRATLSNSTGHGPGAGRPMRPALTYEPSHLDRGRSERADAPALMPIPSRSRGGRRECRR